jgi:hypothetical protein
LLEFEALRERHVDLKFAYLAIRAGNQTEDVKTAPNKSSEKAVQSGYSAFYLAELENQEIISGQWKQFVNHVTENAQS